MGNIVACKTVGIWIIKIKLYGGIVKTLTEVRHGPDQKRNLISFGGLDSNGCKSPAEGGVRKVVKDAMVLIRGNRGWNLYVLSENIVIGVAAVSSSDDHESVSTCSCHLSMGHMSGRGLTILSKRNLLCDTKTCKLDFFGKCIFGIFGMHRMVSFKTVIHRTKGILHYVYSDMWGPSKVSKGRSLYMLTFIDNYSRKVWIYTLKMKNQAFVTCKR